MINTLLQEKH